MKITLWIRYGMHLPFAKSTHFDAGFASRCGNWRMKRFDIAFLGQKTAIHPKIISFCRMICLYGWHLRDWRNEIALLGQKPATHHTNQQEFQSTIFTTEETQLTPAFEYWQSSNYSFQNPYYPCKYEHNFKMFPIFRAPEAQTWENSNTRFEPTYPVTNLSRIEKSWKTLVKQKQNELVLRNHISFATLKLKCKAGISCLHGCMSKCMLCEPRVHAKQQITVQNGRLTYFHSAKQLIMYKYKLNYTNNTVYVGTNHTQSFYEKQLNRKCEKRRRGNRSLPA